MADAEERGEEAGRPRGRGWLVWALVVSVSLNLIWAGGIVGEALRGTMVEKPPASGTTERLFTKLLPTSRHGDWHEALDRIAPEQYRLRMDMARVHERLVGAVREQPFRAETMAAAFEARRRLSTQLNAMTHGEVVQMVAGMSAAERTRLAERLERLAQKWAHRHDVVTAGR